LNSFGFDEQPVDTTGAIEALGCQTQSLVMDGLWMGKAVVIIQQYQTSPPQK